MPRLTDGTGARSGRPAGSREQRPRSRAGSCKSNRSLPKSLVPSFSLIRPFLSPDLTHFGKKRERGSALPKEEAAARGEGGGTAEGERDERDHQHPHRPGRDPGRQRLLGALLPRARHRARWHHAQVNVDPSRSASAFLSVHQFLQRPSAAARSRFSASVALEFWRARRISSLLEILASAERTMGACASVDLVVLFRGRLFLSESVVLLVWSLAPRDGVFWVGYVVLRWAVVLLVAGG